MGKLRLWSNMEKRSFAKKLCRSAVIAALYVVLTIIFGQLAYGPIQIRPSEALTLLPLIYLEAAPALFVGCALANLFSAFGIYDIAIGSVISLIAALLTYLSGKFIANKPLKIFIGGLFPVFLNAFGLPLIWLLASSDVNYWLNFSQILLTQAVFVYGLGTPMYFLIQSFKDKQLRGFN